MNKSNGWKNAQFSYKNMIKKNNSVNMNKISM